MEEHNRIELRSDDVQEIIGTPPRWIVRWGTLVVTGAIFSMVAMSLWVQYPDKVRGRVSITTKIAPVRVNAQKSDLISKIWVEDGDNVKEGDLLVEMQSAANFEDVEELEEFTNDLNNADQSELLEFISSDFKQLEIGTLQPLHAEVQMNFENFQFYEQNKAAAKEIIQYKNQMTGINSGIKIQNRKLTDAKKSEKLERNKYNRIKTLVASNDKSPQELENQEKIWISSQTRVKEIEDEINQRMLRISGLQKNITDIQSSSSETNNQNYINLRSSINNLVGAIDRWNEENLLIAAMPGKISMVQNWSEKQYIEQGKEIMVILPENKKDNYFTQLFIPVQGSGRIQKGQRVLLKLDNFPYREFGQLEGEVIDLPGLSREEGLPVKIKLINGLITQSEKELKLEQELLGNGEIITENRSVFVRIFENVVKPLFQE
ncbi:HlyD family secretion protein [Saprospiraceae bacterium]|jgi:multidrug efflux pump subunit AcrA (membrane-fusion protein)|nr:HlyD family secretion protein [Saprospiraceae bacterium]MDC3210456.1 HlyD family secretion protein [Saprospiraceae bacterium]MDG1434375.1 HlyD family efflux transporter periplasmic adaptor subunit [Saprospiraceae bacterium]